MSNEQVKIGCSGSFVVYASELAIAQYGLEELQRQHGVLKEFPVKTSLSDHVVMVEAASQKEAISKYLNRIKQCHTQNNL